MNTSLRKRFLGLTLSGVVVLAVPVLGCTAGVGAGNLTIPPDAATTCATQCESVGMHLSAVAIMAGNIGCVCEGARDSASTGTSVAQNTASTSAGMATIVMQQEAARQQSQRQQQHAYR